MLGMGMPTVSVYVLTATLLAPSLIKLGVTPMAAHMFVMYFGMLSMITPPVAIAAYAAANIARISTAGPPAGPRCVVGWSTFFIPFLFVTEPSLLMDGSWLSIAWNFSAQYSRHLRRHRGGRSALPSGRWRCRAHRSSARRRWRSCIPPHAFPGADVLDWDRPRRRGDRAGDQLSAERATGKRRPQPQAARP